MYRLIISPVAKAELRGHIAYIRKHNKEAARRQQARINKAVQLLRHYPQLGKVGRLPDTRELVIAGTPYLVIYEFKDFEVHLLHVIHGAQDYP